MKFVNFSVTEDITPGIIRFSSRLFGSIIILFFILNSFFPVKIRNDYSTIILDSDSTLIHAFLNSGDKWRMYTELNEITPELKKAIVYKEDRFFYYHFGVNPVSVVRALFNNLRYKKRTSGASTITMQVVRLLTPKKRTYFNKFIEMFRAFQLEWKYSKDEILQLYLNLVPYGGNIEGVKSASVIYFDKMPNHLSIAEIATLSIIPNRPVSLRLGFNNDKIVTERNKWLDRYASANLFDAKIIEGAKEEPLHASRREIVKYAPHFSYRIKAENRNKSIIYATIDLEIQKKCEAIVKTYSNRMYFKNIRNATVLVVDNAEQKVIAYLGSSDFYNAEDGGQVDGTRAVRSPGSTLKPLLYGIAFDKGTITPKTIISDIPVSFNGYEPENYDEKFHGNISIENALATSLNVPAVKVLEMLKVNELTNTLIKAGFHQIKKDRDHLGLSTVLGGCGVTLEELSGLYCAMANSGSYRPLNYTFPIKDKTETRIISEAASFMLTEILTMSKRPDLPVSWENDPHTPKIAWKTGTSYGRKDAWSIGYNNRYTIGVWLGNFSGEGVPDLNGANIASPLLFQLFNALDYNTNANWFEMPEELDVRYVCSQTGKLPNTFCDDLVLDYFVPGKSSTEKCDHLKEVFVNADSTVSYCTSCLPEAGYVSALYPNLEPGIISYFERNQIEYLKIPEHNPDCERLFAGQKPIITSPVNENEYFVNVEDSMQVMLSCHAANDVKLVFWYINDKFYKSVPVNENVFFVPNEGKVKISCSDDKGRNAEIHIKVKHVDF